MHVMKFRGSIVVNTEPCREGAKKEDVEIRKIKKVGGQGLWIALKQSFDRAGRIQEQDESKLFGQH
jgi:hypothetical protein